MKRSRSLEDIVNNPEEAIFTGNGNEVVKVLLQQEPEKTAEVLGRFETFSKVMRKFVQDHKLWMLLFQRAFREHYDDAAVPKRLPDGRVVVDMKQSVKEMLDRYSQLPGREETYWKRYYEFMMWVPKPYGKRWYPSIKGLKIDLLPGQKPIGLYIYDTGREDRFYLGVSSYDDDGDIEEQTYQVDLNDKGNILVYWGNLNDLDIKRDYHVDFGEHYHLGFMEEVGSNLIIWKRYIVNYMKNLIEFEISQTDGAISISISAFHQEFTYKRTLAIKFEDDDDERDWRSGVVSGQKTDVFDDECFLYRHKNPSENVVYVTPKFVDAEDGVTPIMGEYSRWAYKIRLDDARIELVEVDGSVIGEQIEELDLTSQILDEPPPACWFRWTNFYRTVEYFYDFTNRTLYQSPLPENRKTLVSARYCEHCEDAEANFVEKNKGVPFCSKECQVLYYCYK